MKNLSSNLLPLFLATIISHLFLLNSVDAADKFFEACEAPRRCGDQEISFPFYIKELQEPFCGYPGFDISCHDQPIINLSGDDYVIHNIFYHNHSLIVSNAAFGNISNTASCLPSSLNNLSLPADHFRFTLSPNQTRVFLFYDCPNYNTPKYISYNRPKYNSYNRPIYDRLSSDIVCPAEKNDTNNSYSVLALPESRAVEFSRNNSCGAVVEAPVLDQSLRGNRGIIGDFMEVLRGGFMMKWTASGCEFCESSGGKCGFDNDSFHFKCFCPDLPHASRCGPPGKSITLAVKVGASIAVVVAVLGVVVLILCCLKNPSIFFWKKQNQTCRNVETFLRNYRPLQVKRYNYQEIKKMTKHFKEKLGRGGFGDVYKGKLDDGCLVAVKVLKQSKSDDGREFVNEVAAISRTSHVNVVALLGFCFEGSKRALIYEFMPNGSLERFVFDENTRLLDWEKHYQISVGIARGLEYLHRGCNARIVHFDIKPHNILLDAEFVPKISDFGLAKICNKKESAVSMLVPRGTIGYIAPEVISRNFGEVSHKSDVYSYGMMILEMIGGRRNVNVAAVNTSEIYFPHWIYKRLELDEELGLKEITNEDERLKARKMVIVSLWCIQTDPSSRPTMGKVIEMLEGNIDCLRIPPKPFLSSPASN